MAMRVHVRIAPCRRRDPIGCTPRRGGDVTLEALDEFDLAQVGIFPFFED